MVNVGCGQAVGWLNKPVVMDSMLLNVKVVLDQGCCREKLCSGSDPHQGVVAQWHCVSHRKTLHFPLNKSDNDVNVKFCNWLGSACCAFFVCLVVQAYMLKNKGPLLASMVQWRTFNTHGTFPFLFIEEKVIKMFFTLRGKNIYFKNCSLKGYF